MELKYIISFVLTVIGAFFNGVFLFPQLLKLIKSKSAANLSLLTNIIAVLCAIFWIVYLTTLSLLFVDKTSAGDDVSLQKINRIILLVSSTADWGMFAIGTALLIYQIKWMKSHKGINKIKKQVKSMSEEELVVKIKELKILLKKDSVDIIEQLAVSEDGTKNLISEEVGA